MLIHIFIIITMLIASQQLSFDIKVELLFIFKNLLENLKIV